MAVAHAHLLPGGSLVLQLGTDDQATQLAGELPVGLHEEARRTCEGGVLVHLRAGAA